MPYSTDVAALLANQLAKLVTLNRHQLAGQVANLDFWLGEVRHCLEVIDGYRLRFEQLRTAQQQYVSEHGTIEFDLRDPQDTERPAAPPRRVPEHELRKARRSLCEAASRFLRRCRDERLLTESVLLKACADLGIEV